MAVRPIDGDELLGITRLLDIDAVRQSKTASWLLDQVLHDIQAMPTLTPPNEPLTLDELREMDGEPVCIVFFPDPDGEKLQFWALVAVDEWGEVYLMNNLGGSSAYEEVWADIEAIYRRPPKERRIHEK